MTLPRIYQAVPLQSTTSLTLSADASHHLSRVLRVKINDPLIIFNGRGGEYSAHISAINKKTVTVSIDKFIERDVESPLEMCLAQGISRGEKMDFTIQKAVELGVKKIIPLFTERCNVKLTQERSEKRWQHWQSIIISAAEQSGRTFIPELTMPVSYADWINAVEFECGFVLSPVANSISNQLTHPASITLIVGPEGGLTAEEEQQALAKGCSQLNLGPRILRTETAALTAITALQCYFGDIVIIN